MLKISQCVKALQKNDSKLFITNDRCETIIPHSKFDNLNDRPKPDRFDPRVLFKSGWSPS